MRRLAMCSDKWCHKNQFRKSSAIMDCPVTLFSRVHRVPAVSDHHGALTSEATNSLGCVVLYFQRYDAVIKGPLQAL